MSKKLPPLNWLRTFQAAAQSLSFAAAAEQLNMTSAAVSKQVKNLEYKLGVALFKRLPNGLQLTDHGAAYLPVVRDAIDKLTNATDELFANERAKVLNIKVSLVFFLGWLAPRIDQFYVRYPEIDLRIHSNVWSNEGALEQAADFEIRHGDGNWGGLISQRLTRDTLFPVCSPELLKNNALESISDLNNHNLLHVIGYRNGWATWLNACADEPVKPKSERFFDTLLSAFDLAERGLGVALARSSLVKERLSSGALVAPLSQQLEIDEAFYLVQPQSEVSKNAGLFKEWLISQAE